MSESARGVQPGMAYARDTTARVATQATWPQTEESVEHDARSSRRTVRGLVVFLLVSTLILNVTAPAAPTPTERLLATAIYWLSFIPAILYAREPKEFPFLPLFTVIGTLYHALPVFILDRYSASGYPLSHSSVERGLVLEALGLVALFFGYYVWPGKPVAKKVPRLHWPWVPATARVNAFLLLIYGFFFWTATFVLPVPSQLGALWGLLVSIPQLVILALFALQMRGELGVGLKLLLWCGLLPAQLILGASSALTTQVVMPLFMLLMLYSAVRRRIPWTLLLVGVLVLVPLYTTGHEVRSLSGSGQLTSEGPVGRGLVFFQTAGRYLSSGSTFEESLKQLERRFSDQGLMLLSYVAELTPRQIPYWGGESYGNLLWMFIPRLIYPDKPRSEFGQAFGHRYHFLDASDYTTSKNMPQLVEAYVNFGWLGVIVVMLLLGAFYRGLSSMFEGKSLLGGELVAGTWIFTLLIKGLDSDSTTMLANFPLHVLALSILVKVFGWRVRPQARNAAIDGVPR